MLSPTTLRKYHVFLLLVFHMYLYIRHSYRTLHFSHARVLCVFWEPSQTRLLKQFSFALHFYSCGNSIGWGQMASLWWMGSKGVLLVFWKTNQTRTQSCKKVSSMNSHSLNLSAPTLEQKCHSGGLCMFIVRSFVYILSTLTLSF